MNCVLGNVQPFMAPVAGGGDAVAIRRVYCVGRNYAAHAKEMGDDPSRDPPFFFCKPADSIVSAAPQQQAKVAYPTETKDYQHEIELVVVIGRPGTNIDVSKAEEHVWGYAVGIDMTRRDLQQGMARKGYPWELGKAFDQSAPIGDIVPTTVCGHPRRGSIWLQVDEAKRQDSEISLLIWSVPEIIANLSRYFALMPGDVIFTGTPEGVGAVQRGQRLRGGIEGLGEVSIQIV